MSVSELEGQAAARFLRTRSICGDHLLQSDQDYSSPAVPCACAWARLPSIRDHIAQIATLFMFSAGCMLIAILIFALDCWPCCFKQIMVRMSMYVTVRPVIM